MASTPAANCRSALRPRIALAPRCSVIPIRSHSLDSLILGSRPVKKMFPMADKNQEVFIPEFILHTKIDNIHDTYIIIYVYYSILVYDISQK